MFPSIHLPSGSISSMLLPSSHDAGTWHWLFSSLPPLPRYRELSLPRPAFQTHFLFPKVNIFSFQDPTSPPCVDPQTSDSFSSFSALGAAHHSCFSFIAKSSLLSWRPRNHTVFNHTVAVINTGVPRPLLFYLHYSPTFITGVLLPRTKIQTIISQCTGLSLSSHLISFISSDSWPCAFAFSLCSSVKCPLFFKALLKIQLSNQHSSFLITGNLT